MFKKNVNQEVSEVTENPKKKAKTNQAVIKKTVQQLFPAEKFFDNGVIQVSSDEYSKAYLMNDANFMAETEMRQETLLKEYKKILNKFPTNCYISIVIVNRRETVENLRKNYHLPYSGKKTDKYCDNYNYIIDDKIAQGNNDIKKDKFIVLTVKTQTYAEAVSLLDIMEGELNSAVKVINKSGVKPLSAYDRTKLMFAIFNGNERNFDTEFSQYITVDDGVSSLDCAKIKKHGTSVKNMVCPSSIVFDRGTVILGEDRYCKSNMFTNFPPTLDVKFLTGITNIPYEMVTTIHLRNVPRKKAQTLVKMQNNSIKADVIKASQQAYRNGYDPSLMNEDLMLAQQEARELRQDVIVNGEKMFYMTFSNTVFAKSKEELDEVQKLFELKCQDFSISPNPLMGQQKRGLMSSLLLGNKELVLDRLVTGDDCCAIFPYNIQEICDSRGHFYGINALSKNMIMYDRKRSRLANGLVFGQSGTGKSFIVKGEIIPNLLDLKNGEDDIVILDPENEYRLVAEEFGGNVIDLDVKGDLHINPCDLNMEWDNPKASPLTEKSDFMVGLVESIMGRGRECNSMDINAISRACSKMYERYIETMTERHEKGDENCNIDVTIMPTLVDFYNYLIEDGSGEAKKIAQFVEPYAVGSYNVFAHRTNIKSNNRLTVYNLLYLPEKMQEMAMKVCLSSIWNKICENKERNEKMGTNKSIWVYLDEFHLFFKTESSASTIMAYYKRVRKYGGIMTGITQDVADLLSSRQGEAMFNNTGFFIFLGQSPIGRQKIQMMWNVSDALIEYLDGKGTGIGLIYNSMSMIPFDYTLDKTTDLYRLMSTNPNDADDKSTKAGQRNDDDDEDEYVSPNAPKTDEDVFDDDYDIDVPDEEENTSEEEDLTESLFG